MGVSVPDVPPDVDWYSTTQTGWGWLNDITIVADAQPANFDGQTMKFTYSVSSAKSATEQFANGWSWNTSVKVTGGVGIPLITEAKVEATVGFAGHYDWTHTDMTTKTETRTSESSFPVKKGDIVGLSPFGKLTSYRTAYHHKDGRMTYQNWTTFDVTSWAANKVSDTIDPTTVDIDASMCMGTKCS